MANVTIFCVQPFWRAGGRKLAQGDLRQYRKEDDARRAGEAAARRNAGALVYSITGDPDYESWGPPMLIATHGDVPAIEF